MKFTQRCINLLPFRPFPVLVAVHRVSCQIRNLNSWTSEIVSRVLTKGRRVGGGQNIDFKMESDHDWSQDMRLQGCAGFLVTDM